MYAHDSNYSKCKYHSMREKERGGKTETQNRTIEWMERWTKRSIRKSKRWTHSIANKVLCACVWKMNVEMNGSEIEESFGLRMRCVNFIFIFIFSNAFVCQFHRGLLWSIWLADIFQGAYSFAIRFSLLIVSHNVQCWKPNWQNREREKLRFQSVSFTHTSYVLYSCEWITRQLANERRIKNTHCRSLEWIAAWQRESISPQNIDLCVYFSATSCARPRSFCVFRLLFCRHSLPCCCCCYCYHFGISSVLLFIFSFTR